MARAARTAGRGRTSGGSRNDAPGDLAVRPGTGPDPVLAERYARRRRAVVAAAVAFVFLGGTGCLSWAATPWPF